MRRDVVRRAEMELPATTTKKNKPLILTVCATGITCCYMYYGTVQELVFHIDRQDSEGGSGSITLFLLATNTCSSFLLAWMWTIVGPILLQKNSSKNSNNIVDNSCLNHPLIVLTSITYLLAMAASNESLHYVSYPTCVLAKSSKLIPTMIVGWLVDRHHRRNNNNCNNNNNNVSHHSKSSINVMEWIGVILITVGILSFQYIQLQKQQTSTTTNHGTVNDEGDSPYGLALLGLSLCMDGLMAACQNSLKRGSSSNNSDRQNNSISSEVVTSSYQRRRRRPPSAMETMLYINLYATLILLPLSYYAGQFQRGIDAMTSSSSCSTSGSSKSSLLLQLNVSASLGQVFIFLTIHHFSPLTCTTITTTRKFFTILLSVYKFGHVLSFWQWCSVTLVFAGLYMEIVAKLLERGDDDSVSLKTMKKKKD